MIDPIRLASEQGSGIDDVPTREGWTQARSTKRSQESANKGLGVGDVFEITHVIRLAEGRGAESNRRFLMMNDNDPRSALFGQGTADREPFRAGVRPLHHRDLQFTFHSQGGSRVPGSMPSLRSRWDNANPTAREPQETRPRARIEIGEGQTRRVEGSSRSLRETEAHAPGGLQSPRFPRPGDFAILLGDPAGALPTEGRPGTIEGTGIDRT